MIIQPNRHVPTGPIISTASNQRVTPVVPTTKEDYPSFRQWRKKNDPIMKPDRGFSKQLKCLDPEFDVVWDWGANKWEIWKFPADRPEYHVLTVQTQNKTYRELGTDIILKLQESMLWDRFTLNELVAYFDEMDNQVYRRKAKDFKNKIEDITSDTFNYVSGVLHIQVPRKYKVRRMIDGSRTQTIPNRSTDQKGYDGA